MTTLDIDKHSQLRELIEDTVEYWCDEHMISGELAYIVVETIAEAKLMQFRGLIK
jgi:hypothetical protein